MNQETLKYTLKKIKQYELPVSLFFGLFAILSTCLIVVRYSWPYLAKIDGVRMIEQRVSMFKLPPFTLPTSIFAPKTPYVPTATSATSAQQTARVHKTTATDTLWKLAQTYYNDGYTWTKIYEANKDKIKNPNVLEKDLELVIPE